MNYVIDKSKGSSYMQLYKYLREDIINGTYGYGKKLPSKRLLAEETGVSTITVEHSYALLCDEGYAEARERCGYYAIFRRSDGFALPAEIIETRVQSSSHEDIETSFPFQTLSKTMRKVISCYGDRIMEKSPNSGMTELRSALREYLARNRGIHVDNDQIVIGSGSEYLYSLIIELLGRDRIVAIESPSYNKIEQVYQASEISYEALPLAQDGIESAALLSTKASVLHTTPYRSFPSGVSASASKRHEYIRWAKAGDRFLIEDDYESEFSVSTKPMETLYSLSGNDSVIYLNTFSKTISPAMRVAYMLIPKKLVSQFEEKLGFYSCTVPAFEQFLIAELINNGEFERHINRVRRNIRESLK